MSFELIWGEIATAHLSLPTRSMTGYALLLLYGLIYTYLLYRFRNDFARFSRWRWLALLGLIAASLLLSQLALPWPLAGTIGPPGANFSPLALAATLLAGATLGPGAALIVGFMGGLSLALWQTHHIYDPFFIAFIGALYGFFLFQRYPGVAYRWLRRPLIAGVATPVLLALLLVPQAFAYSAPELSLLAALDQVLVRFGPALILLFVEGLLGSLVVFFVLLLIPRWRPQAPSPAQPGVPVRTIRGRLMANYALLSISIGLLSIAIIYSLSVTYARRIVVDEMALTAQAISSSVPAFRAQTMLSSIGTGDGRDELPSYDIDALQGALSDLLQNLPTASEPSKAIIMDEDGQIVVQVGQMPLLEDAINALEKARRARPSQPGNVGAVYEGTDETTSARQLIYLLQSSAHSWSIIYALPHDAVLAAAIPMAAPLTGILLLVLGIFAVNMLYASRSVTEPLQDLLVASQQVADGRLEEPIPSTSEDEFGQLGHALESVRVSIKHQVSELSLLLTIGQQVSSSLNVSDGLPIILQGAVQGNNADGARAVVLNPSGRYPLTYGIGEAAPAMQLLDRRLTSLLRNESQLLLPTPTRIRRKFGAPDDAVLPVRALAAMAIYSGERFLGILWVGYKQPHHFTAQELELLRTLAGQAAGLVENARLFSTAEGGRRRLAAVLASTADAVIVTDQTERILLINPAMEGALNLQASTVVGRPVADIVRSSELLAALLDGGRGPRRVEITTPDGRIFLVSASTIYSNEGQVLGRVAVLHDVSQLKKIDELKSEFVATVSHDLRGPLTSMTGYSAMLPLVGDMNSDQKAYLGRIQAGIVKMTDLVENLLDLRRLEAGKVLARETIVARSMLQQVAADLAEQARGQGIRLQVQVAPNVPNVTGDIVLIQRAIANLVENAIKYAPESGIVMLAAVHEGDEVIFSVQDRGPGIAKEDQERLFETFYQVKKRDDRDRKGSGLGLAIVKSIAEHHGGRVWFVSLPGTGSTFYLALPTDDLDPGQA